MGKTLEEKMASMNRGMGDSVTPATQKTEEHKEEKHDEKGNDEELTTASPKDAVQKRINKLVAEKKGEKEAHEKTRLELEDLKKKIPKTEAPMTFKGEPKFEDFKTIDDFKSAMRKYHTQETSKQIETKLRDEYSKKEMSSKLSKVMERGKNMTEDHGLEPEEYMDRINTAASKMKVHRNFEREILDSDHAPMIMLDIADHLDELNKMADDDKEGNGVKQIKWLTQREEFHKRAKNNNGPEEKVPRKTTKAAMPDRDLTTGSGEDKGFTKKDGSVNFQNLQKAIKAKLR